MQVQKLRSAKEILADRRERYQAFRKYMEEVKRVNDDHDLPFSAVINSFSVEPHREHFLGLNETQESDDWSTDLNEIKEAVDWSTDLDEIKEADDWSTDLDEIKEAGDWSTDDQEVAEEERSAASDYVDWKHSLSAPTEQGGCGCCWAFSAVATIESAFYRSTGIKKEFSQQTVVDW